jgi:hypothetical protein
MVEGSQGFLDDLRQATLRELGRPIPEARRRYRSVDGTAVNRMREAADRVVERHRRPKSGE